MYGISAREIAAKCGLSLLFTLRTRFPQEVLDMARFRRSFIGILLCLSASLGYFKTIGKDVSPMRGACFVEL